MLGVRRNDKKEPLPGISSLKSADSNLSLILTFLNVKLPGCLPLPLLSEHLSLIALDLPSAFLQNFLKLPPSLELRDAPWGIYESGPLLAVRGEVLNLTFLRD